MLTRHSSVPSRVLGSPKWAHTGFTAISDRAGCATKCGRGCFFKKKKMFHRRLRQCVCVCVLANCRCYNDFHPTPLMRWHFGLLLPSCNPTWGQSGGVVSSSQPASCPWICFTLARIQVSLWLRQAESFLETLKERRWHVLFLVLFSRKSYFLHVCDVHEGRCVIYVYARFVYCFHSYPKKKVTFGSLWCVGNELVLYSVYYPLPFLSITF